MESTRHIIVVLLQNEFGALSRVANLFSARGYNIESLNVATTPDPTMSRMTITSIGSQSILDQIIKQLNKLIDVVDAHACRDTEHQSTEYALLRLHRSEPVQALVHQWELDESVHLDLIEQNEQQLIVGVSADTRSLESMLGALEPGCLLEISRSGTLAVRRCQSKPGSED